MAVNKLQLIIVVGLLSALFVAIVVDATCNQCKNSHACINETSFQICYNGIRNETINLNCPSDRPICTDYSSICMPNVTSVTRGCGDVSKCAACEIGDIYACTSLNTFGRCSDGVLTTGRVTCPNNYVCSTSGAALNENICISRCNSEDDDICDRLEEINDNDSTTTTSSTSVTDSTTTTSSTSETDSTITTSISTSETDSTITTSSSTSLTDSTTTSSSTSVTGGTTTTTTTTTTTSTTTISPTITPTEYCANVHITGRYPIPNDTECTSYIYCFFRANTWQTVTYNCTVSKPYFNANATVCGTTKPTGVNCTN